MSKQSKYKSEAFEAIHSAVRDMYEVGAIDESRMKRFDDLCLNVPSPLKPQQIRKLRKRLCVSQPAFSRQLNVSESTVQKWESGAKKPSGVALKLLSIVQKHGLEILS